MKPTLAGIHHVTAIAGDPQANLDFYAGVLGLRLVKKTVNFDDPGTYHLYYGDAAGRPGTLLTFFPWPGAERGRPGAGQATTTAFRVPASSLDFWRDRLEAAGLKVTEIIDRQYFTSIYFREPGGVLFEIATDGPGFTRDEEPERLGRRLTLPPWLEDRRGEIEAKLPPLSVPAPAAR